MALIGLGGIDNFLFGTGLLGAYAINTDEDINGAGDKMANTISIAKLSGGDPDFVVRADGVRLFARESIEIGAGVTVTAQGAAGFDDGSGRTPGAGGVSGVLGSGTAGGAGGINAAGTTGTTSTAAYAGSGGVGGAGSGNAGGGAGTVSAASLFGAISTMDALVLGHVFINGVLHVIRGGGGGGGGGASGGGAEGGQGGGGGGNIVLCAPKITIAGTLTARGGVGNSGNVGGGTNAGGGAGGGGGRIILVCAQLVLTGTINVNGGNGGAANGAGGIGGAGGAGGKYILFTPSSNPGIVITTGSSGSAGANG